MHHRKTCEILDNLGIEPRTFEQISQGEKMILNSVKKANGRWRWERTKSSFKIKGFIFGCFWVESLASRTFSFSSSSSSSSLYHFYLRKVAFSMEEQADVILLHLLDQGSQTRGPLEVGVSAARAFLFIPFIPTDINSSFFLSFSSRIHQ